MELLRTFMECSIAILAFSAIVAEFRKRSNKSWNVRLYQGIIAHTIQAFVYSCLPLLANEFTGNERLIWTGCGLLLGVVTFLQGVAVMRADKSTILQIRLITLLLSFIILALQLLYIFGILNSGSGVYSLGVFWHLFQAIIIISMFMLNPDTE